MAGPSTASKMPEPMRAKKLHSCGSPQPGRPSSLSEDIAARRSKRVSRAIAAASGLTQEELGTALGKTRAYVERRLSRDEQWESHHFTIRDVFAGPEEMKRILRDELDEDLGEESRPIADAGDGALLRAVVGGLKDAAFVLRAALEDELLDEADEAEIREASVELMTLLGALAHRCGGAKAGR